MQPQRQVVVTGMGTVNGLGTNCQSFWEHLCAGETSVQEISRFDSTAWRSHIASEITGPLPESGHPDRVHDFVISAAKEALVQAGEGPGDAKTAVVLGSLQGGIGTLETIMGRQVKEGVPLDFRSSHLKYSVSSVSRYAASYFGWHGPVITSSVACAASGAAISRAVDLIRLGVTDAAICGGADTFSVSTFSGFNSMRSLATEQCRPFSIDRDGLVVGEGAGVLVLESAEVALRRGARPLAVILGTGLAEDAYHLTAPDPEGGGAVRAMEAAIQDAHIEKEEVHYINAHGTGTPQNDRMESHAVRLVFGERANQIPVSSIKGAIGHCMGAAGAIEAITSISALLYQKLPPTLHFTPGDDQCTLDYVPNQSRNAALDVVLSNSFGFAGNNASVLFGRVEKYLVLEAAG